MEPPGWNWPAVAALATVAVTVVTVAYAVATCFFIRSGFRKMDRAFDERAADRQRAWAALEAEQRRHEEAMEDSRRREEAMPVRAAPAE